MISFSCSCFLDFNIDYYKNSKSHQGKIKNSIKLIAYTLLVGLFISSCNENSVQTSIDSEPSNSELLKEQNQSKNINVEFPTINRYGIELTISESPSLNKTGVVKATASAYLSSADTELSIIMPELDAMHAALQTRGNLNRIEIPVNKELISHRKEFPNVFKGQEISSFVDLRVPEPGYYSIYATVTLKNQDDAELNFEDGTYIRNLATKHLWLYVDEKETKITGEFEEDLVPKKYIVQPGPFTLRGEQSRLHYVSQEASFKKEIPGMQQSQSNDIIITATYMDVSSSTVKPLANADVDFAIYDEYEEAYVAGATITTNAHGEVSIGCTSTQYWTYEVDFLSENSDVKISDSNASSIVRSTSGDYSHCGLSYGVTTSQNRSHVYGVASEVVKKSDSFFGKGRSKTIFSLDPNPPLGNNSYYNPNNDSIVILDDPNGTSHVGGSFGDFVVAHEYGHAFHEKGLGGNEGGFCREDDDDNNGHGNSEPISLRCAFSEGFASFTAYVSDHPFFNFETRDYTSNGTIDASIVEGAVASFYVDLTDDTIEPHDNIDLPGSYVADIIIDCEVYSGWRWKRPDGIDELIACFENQIPNYSNYFLTRSIEPTSYDENVQEPSGWTKSKIEDVWKKIFFNEL